MRNPIFDDLFLLNDETIEKPKFFTVFGLKKTKILKTKILKTEILKTKKKCKLL